MFNFAKAVFFILGLSLLMSLGCWQLHRAAEKQTLLAQAEHQAKQSPMRWRPTEKNPTQYARIQLHGRYVEPVFYLDNQSYQHQFGVHVLSPFEVDGRLVMVDRGWVKSRPTIRTPFGEQNVMGTAYYPQKNPWIGAEQPGSQLIEQFDVTYLSKILHRDVTPFIMRLDSEQPFGFIREWSVSTLSPARHWGYAFQWFALAGLFLVYGAIYVKKRS